MDIFFVIIYNWGYAICDWVISALAIKYYMTRMQANSSWQKIIWLLL